MSLTKQCVERRRPFLGQFDDPGRGGFVVRTTGSRVGSGPTWRIFKTHDSVTVFSGVPYGDHHSLSAGFEQSVLPAGAISRSGPNPLDEGLQSGRNVSNWSTEMSFTVVPLPSGQNTTTSADVAAPSPKWTSMGFCET